MDEKTRRDALNYVAGLVAATSEGQPYNLGAVIADADKVARYIEGGEIPDGVGAIPKKPYDTGPGMAELSEAAAV